MVKDMNRKKNNLEMQMQNLNGNTKKEKRQIGEKVDSLPGKKNDKQNNSVGYKNYINAKMINDKLIIKIKDLEIDLNNRKQKEMVLKQSFLDMEERNDLLIGKN